MWSLEQGKEFNNRSNDNVLDKMYGKLSHVARAQQVVVEEGLQGMNTQPTINQLRQQLSQAIGSINADYQDEVLHNSRLIDDFDKKVDAQRKKMVDAYKAASYRGDDRELKSLQGRVEDSTTFLRLGNARYIVFAILAIVILSFTFHHTDMNTSGYVLVSIILGAVVIFIVNFIHERDIQSS
jgi:hypothetical protein